MVASAVVQVCSGFVLYTAEGYSVNLFYRPTSRSSGGTNQNNNGVALPVGLADDQAKDFDFEKTEMKYDSTGMFHWGPAKNLEDCLLVGFLKKIVYYLKFVIGSMSNVFDSFN